MKEAIHDFNTLVLWIIVIITAFVMALLAVVVFRFRRSVNPTPSRTSHNTMIEIAWTVIPVLILVVIAIPSFRLIYFQDRARDADLTINVQGRQWYWHYAYPDNGNFAYDSRPIPTEDLKDGQLRNLTVDEPLVIPVGATVRVLTTGQDVIRQLLRPLARRAEVYDPRPDVGDMVQGRPRRHFLRPVQPDLWDQPLVHADPGAGDPSRRVPGLGRVGEKKYAPGGRRRGARWPRCRRRQRSSLRPCPGNPWARLTLI
ncbi:cytochrome c oxidase subunit II transmembrane domain-containing protein [Dankookia sp. P2]|uniref:cytochrome c oxidase subunit II transmembrane domain-containing protein n=1 Tax=Dankookia sp. P2 TaxID=3423955 RepID=UPI003D66C811